MARSSERTKGRGNSARIAVLPHAVMNHPAYMNLSGSALRLLLEMIRQYNGYSNNGNLAAAWEIMRKRGFKSKATLAKALKELLDSDFLIRTREGRFQNPGKQCALYAVTWAAIDECPGKRLEVGPTKTPPRSFSAEIIKMPGTETVPTRPKSCTEGERNHG